MIRRISGLLGLFALLFGLTMAGATGQVLAQEGTPEATPAAEETDEEATGEETAPNIVTLVAWYQADEENDLLVLVPLQISPAGVASPGQANDQALNGSVDFEAERNAGGLPRITLGNSIFDAYPLVEGDRNSVQQWFFFQGNESGRPATLVMQVTADAGPYEGAIGTATFISRSLDSTGVVVIVLYLAE
ncbi:MAG: hypothetical protein IT334_10910 [Thermomicrobiales bacterium]|nr:hypothetical protein [Thermomicrobiales bacterium]